MNLYQEADRSYRAVGKAAGKLVRVYGFYGNLYKHFHSKKYTCESWYGVRFAKTFGSLQRHIWAKF